MQFLVWDLFTQDFKSWFWGLFGTTEMCERVCAHVLLTGERVHDTNQSLKEVEELKVKGYICFG